MSNTEELNKLFGTSLEDLSHTPDRDLPPVVPGRVLHIDGDFLAYQVSADDTKSVDTMKHNHDIIVEELRLLAGAEKTLSHLTASHGDKGNRYELAVQKEYQGNRKDKVKPKYLHHIKSWMASARGALSHEDQEADDGLCQGTWKAIRQGTPELAVLTSKDKDLRMCQGYQLDWDTGELVYVDGFGYIDLDTSKSTPKIIGRGNKFFWAQMLQGDAADNIQGVPTVCGKVLNRVKPTKTISAAWATVKDPKASKAKKAKAFQKLDARKPSKCGVMLTFDLLEKVKSDKEAFDLVKHLYKRHGETTGFVHWQTGEAVEWKKAMFSEMQLLWMRRNKDQNDVLKFIKEINR